VVGVLLVKLMRPREQRIDLGELLLRQKVFSRVDLQLEALFADLFEYASDQVVLMSETPHDDRW
jgi:hypothetical protein